MTYADLLLRVDLHKRLPGRRKGREQEDNEGKVDARAAGNGRENTRTKRVAGTEVETEAGREGVPVEIWNRARAFAV